jgi:hypothetical protein
MQKKPNRKISEKAATGITVLDKVLSGGLSRRKGYLIQGPLRSGKSSFAMQILYTALKRDEPCIYISYSATYKEILRYFDYLSFDVRPFMEAKKFRIIDHYSLAFDTMDSIGRNLTELEHESIYFVGREIDDESYIAIHYRIRQEIGYGGINVIDDVSDYLRFTSIKKALIRQDRLRLLFSQKAGLIGLHVFTIDEQNKNHSEYMKRKEDATFSLIRKQKEWYMHLHLQLPIKNKKFELGIKERKIDIIREYPQESKNNDLLKETHKITKAILKKEKKLESALEIVKNNTRMINFELSRHDPFCPCIFTFTPLEKTIYKTDLLNTTYQLHLWCQYTEGWHPTEKGGVYEISNPRKWMKVLQPVARTILPYLKPALALFKTATGLDVTPSLDVKALYAELALMEKLIQVIPDDLLNIDNTVSSHYSKGKPPRLEGAHLRGFYHLLDELDPSHYWGGLREFKTESGEWIWVCEKHYKKLQELGSDQDKSTQVNDN